MLAACAMNMIDSGRLRLNRGVRLENTAVNFSGNAATTPLTGPQAVRRVTGRQNYTNLIPSAQLRSALFGTAAGSEHLHLR